MSTEVQAMSDPALHASSSSPPPHTPAAAAAQGDPPPPDPSIQLPVSAAPPHRLAEAEDVLPAPDVAATSATVTPSPTVPAAAALVPPASTVAQTAAPAPSASQVGPQERVWSEEEHALFLQVEHETHNHLSTSSNFLSKLLQFVIELALPPYRALKESGLHSIVHLLPSVCEPELPPKFNTTQGSSNRYPLHATPSILPMSLILQHQCPLLSFSCL
jgi:hypothetical protein